MALERAMERMNDRLSAVERAQTRIDVGEEMRRIESELAPIEAAVQAERIEAEIRAAAVRLEATTPHYPRA